MSNFGPIRDVPPVEPGLAVFLRQIKLAVEKLIESSEASSYINYVDRGDISAFDVTLSNLTTDGAWRNLDLGSIIPAGASVAHVRVVLAAPASGMVFSIRANLYDNSYNVLTGVTQAGSVVTVLDGLVSLDSSRFVEYSATSGTWTTISILVRGWFI